MKAQISVEFMVSAFLTISVMGFILFSLMDDIPVMHREAVYELEKSEGYRATQLMITSQGSWQSASDFNISFFGLTDGIPYTLNYTKIRSLDQCNSSNYAKLKKLMEIGENRNFVLNISKINLSGGPDEKISECYRNFSSTLSPRYWVKRMATINQSGIASIVKIELAIY